MTFPLMPQVGGGGYVPPFSATLKFSGDVTTGGTLDVSSYVTSSYSTLMVIQLYNAGGGETFYYPPTAKMNGVDMPLITSKYTNSFDDGDAIAISTISAQRGASYTVTWTSSRCYGVVYEVLGFRDMFSALNDTQATVNLLSNNSGIGGSTTTVNANSTSKVLYTAYGDITVGTDASGKMDQANYLSSWEIGWDYNPSTPTSGYTGANRIRVVSSFNI